jgi:mono/diheme cytochrome c family protein
MLKRGAEIYAAQCAGCHGVGGDGRGDAAAILYPKPRDFVAAEYKFSSRPTPGLPTDEDLRQVIRRGLSGTSMSGFPHMPESDVESLIAFLKTFSDRWEEPQASALTVPEDPWVGYEDQGIKKGREVYHVEAVCISCHPSYMTNDEITAVSERLGFAAIPLREDAHLSIPRENADGSLVFPPDFRRDRIKSGHDLRNLYRVISAGITTTAMPTWDGVLDSRQLWGLAHYIRSLSEERPRFVDPEAYALRPRIDPSLPPDEEAAEAFEGGDLR